MVRIEVGSPDCDKIAHLDRRPAADQVGDIGPPFWIAAAADLRAAQTRKQHGGGVLVRGEVELDAVEQRF